MRQIIAVIQQANRTRPAKHRTPLVRVSGLGDEAWKQSHRQALRTSTFTDVRLIVRKGNSAFQIYADAEAWIEEGFTATKLRSCQAGREAPLIQERSHPDCDAAAPRWRPRASIEPAPSWIINVSRQRPWPPAARGASSLGLRRIQHRA